MRRLEWRGRGRREDCLGEGLGGREMVRWSGKGRRMRRVGETSQTMPSA